jgi:hypothetical protein
MEITIAIVVIIWGFVIATQQDKIIKRLDRIEKQLKAKEK